MAREEQVKKAAEDSYMNYPILCGDKEIEYFCRGVRWADAYPNWHKYPDELPNHEGEYLVFCSDGDCTLDKFVIEKGTKGQFWRMQNICRCDDNNVKCWMEKPNPPRYDWQN